MSFGSSSPPQPMNPTAVANQQQQYNTLSAEQNQAGSAINQFNPYGSLQYTQSGTGPGGIPLYSANLSFNPTQQQLLNVLTGTQQSAGQQGQNLIQGANYGATSPADAIGTGASGISGNLMSGYLGLMQPFFTTQTQQLDTQLRNQGLSPSPTANPSDPSSWGPYERAMYQNTSNQAREVGGAAAQFQPQAFSEATQLYQMPAQLGENLAQFAQPTSPGGSLVQTPGFSTQAPDYTSAVKDYQNTLEQNYAQQMQQQDAMIQGLFGAAGNIGGGWARGGFARPWA
jgi:hypothetical protein